MRMTKITNSRLNGKYSRIKFPNTAIKEKLAIKTIL